VMQLDKQRSAVRPGRAPGLSSKQCGRSKRLQKGSNPLPHAMNYKEVGTIAEHETMKIVLKNTWTR